MGMAASQARFLSLTARKTNVEYEGQQINQQRLALSNESSNYYSTLCNLDVPTPPSTQDYSKTTYTFKDGSETNTVNSLIAKQNGLYILNYTQSYEAEGVVSNGSVVTTRRYDASTGETSYYVGSTKLRTMEAGISPEDPRVKTDSYLSTLSIDELTKVLEMENTYLELLQNKYGKKDWYVRYQVSSTTGAYEPVFYDKEQVDNATYSEATGTSVTGIKSYVYGMNQETREIKNATARVEQDTAGRYIKLFIYETNEDGSIKTDDNGNELYTSYPLTATTTTDENAYNDAMNKYNYDKTKYDQEIQTINSKIEVLQNQDKNLELKLKQLDTEQSAISSELEAVKKVISKNVDSSFKTFNA